MDDSLRKNTALEVRAAVLLEKSSTPSFSDNYGVRHMIWEPRRLLLFLRSRLFRRRFLILLLD